MHKHEKCKIKKCHSFEANKMNSLDKFLLPVSGKPEVAA